jgi:hypothetical protein
MGRYLFSVISESLSSSSSSFVRLGMEAVCQDGREFEIPRDSTVPATRKTAEDDDDDEEDWDVTLNRLRDSLA